MTLSDFQSFVNQNAAWFQGVHPESPDSFQLAESLIGHQLPASLKWLLTEWGYSEACGVDSLEEAVKATIGLRGYSDLAIQYIVLNNWQDAGFVIMDTRTISDTGEYRIYWTTQENVLRLVAGEAIDKDIDVFEGYPEWTRHRLGDAQDVDT